MWIITVALFFASFPAFTQTADSQGPTDLAVVKFSWSKAANPQQDSGAVSARNRDHNIDDTIDDNRRLEDLLRDPDPAKASEYERRRREKESTLPPSAQREGYRYRVTLENTGKKTVQAVHWDYVFFNPETGAESDRHQFYSREKISPGKKKELSAFDYSPPTRTVNANEADKKIDSQLKASIVINRIEYTDGSIWQRDSFTPPDK
ncbi:MAG: hypothetical protein AB1631_17790 [Acidobacteriota bacterium]